MHGAFWTCHTGQEIWGSAVTLSSPVPVLWNSSLSMPNVPAGDNRQAEFVCVCACSPHARVHARCLRVLEWIFVCDVCVKDSCSFCFLAGPQANAHPCPKVPFVQQTETVSILSITRCFPKAIHTIWFSPPLRNSISLISVSVASILVDWNCWILPVCISLTSLTVCLCVWICADQLCNPALEWNQNTEKSQRCAHQAWTLNNLDYFPTVSSQSIWVMMPYTLHILFYPFS